MFVSEKNAYIKDLNAFKNFNELSTLYVFIKVKGGGALLHVYVWEHIVSL